MIWVWCARVCWALLPVTTGTAFADALAGWSTAPALAAAIMLWLAWAAGLVVMFVPRPWGLTFLRVVAPAGVICSTFTVTSTSVAAAVLALVGALVAAALALSTPIAAATANALAYGDEWRVPLRIPMPLLVGPVPVAVVVIAAGATVGILLLAAGHLILGVVLTVVGLPAAFLVARALHALSLRWLVFVPAGLAIVDPLSLVEPTLVRREEIAAVHPYSGTASDEELLDLRIGTLGGSILIELREPVGFTRRRDRKTASVVSPRAVALAVTSADAVVARAQARRPAPS